MRTIELSEAKHCLPQLCESVVQTGDRVVILANQEPLVTLAPASKRKEVKPSVWEARIRFEQEQGALTEEFDIPPHSVIEGIQMEDWGTP